ncbi:MAG: DHH family phosphoesterase, partial [Calditrichaceae bacterium]
MQASNEHREIAERIYRFIQENDNFLISAHINSDGDAIASVLAVRMLLNKLNKNSVMVFHDQKLDQRFMYLSGFDQIVSYKEKLDISAQIPGGQIENAIILDVPGYSRLGDVSGLLPLKDHIVKIDHHPSEDVIGIIDWVDQNASSSTVMVYEVFEASGISPDVSMAEAIFTGIIYDTGRFSFSNTTARDLYVCSKMVQIGVQPS